MFRQGSFVLTTSLGVVSCLGSDAREGPTASSASALVNGTAVTTCGFASTGWVGNCTANVIHPRVIVTAAHCGKPASIRLGGNAAGAVTIATTACTVHPDWKGGFAWDFTVCVLASDAPVPISPPAVGCEAEGLVSGTPVVAVGLGKDHNGVFGVKRAATLRFANMIPNSPPAFLINDPNAVPSVQFASGDSGGPTFRKLPDGTYRQLGVHSAGAPNGGVDNLLAPAVPWIEQSTGFDVTPCHDANGTWAPGPDCVDLPTDPAVGAGNWPACTTPIAPGQGASCASGSDASAPGADAGAPGTDASSASSSTGTERDGVDEGAPSPEPRSAPVEATPGRGCRATASSSEGPLAWPLLMVVTFMAGLRQRAARTRARERSNPALEPVGDNRRKQDRTGNG